MYSIMFNVDKLYKRCIYLLVVVVLYYNYVNWFFKMVNVFKIFIVGLMEFMIIVERIEIWVLFKLK